MKKAHPRTSLSNVHSENHMVRRQCPSFAKRALPSFPRDRWRACRLISSNSIGSEWCLEFVIFSQPVVRITVIHDWATTFIVIHDRFTTNGYALPVLHGHNHKMDLQWKPQSNLYKKNFTLLLYEVVIEISSALWICNFLATNDKGYDNSRLISDDIHRGSRQIHGKWLRFTCPSCT